MFDWFRKMFFIKNKVASAVISVGVPSPPYTRNTNDIPRFESNTLHGLFESNMSMEKIFAVLDKLTPSQRKRACEKHYGRNKNFFEAVIDSDHPQRVEFIAGLATRLGDDAAELLNSKIFQMIWPKDILAGRKIIGTDYPWMTQDLRKIIISMTPYARMKICQSYYRDLGIGCPNIMLEAMRIGRTDLLDILLDEIGITNARPTFLKMNGPDAPLFRILAFYHSSEMKQALVKQLFRILDKPEHKIAACAHRLPTPRLGNLNVMQVAVVTGDSQIFDELIDAIGYDEAAKLVFSKTDSFENHLKEYEILMGRNQQGERYVHGFRISLNENLRDRLFELYTYHTLRKKPLYSQPVTVFAELLEKLTPDRRKFICSTLDSSQHTLFHYALLYGGDEHVTEIFKTYGYDKSKEVFNKTKTIIDVVKYKPTVLPLILDFIDSDELVSIFKGADYSTDLLRLLTIDHNKVALKQILNKLKLEDIYRLSNRSLCANGCCQLKYKNIFKDVFHEIQLNRSRTFFYNNNLNHSGITQIDPAAGVGALHNVSSNDVSTERKYTYAYTYTFQESRLISDLNYLYNIQSNLQLRASEMNKFKNNFMRLSRDSQLRICEASISRCHLTLIHLASSSGDVQLLELVINHLGGSEAIVNTRSLSGWTALHSALFYGNTVCVEKILSLISPEQLLEIDHMTIFIDQITSNLEYCSKKSGKAGLLALYQTAMNNAKAAVDQKVAATTNPQTSLVNTQQEHAITSADDSEYSDDSERIAPNLLSEVATLHQQNQALQRENARLIIENGAKHSQYDSNIFHFQQLKNDNARLAVENEQLKMQLVTRPVLLSSGLDTLNSAQFSEHTLLLEKNAELTRRLTAEEEEKAGLLAEVAELHARLIALESLRTPAVAENTQSDPPNKASSIFIAAPAAPESGGESESTSKSASPVIPASPAMLMAGQGLFSHTESPRLDESQHQGNSISAIIADSTAWPAVPGSEQGAGQPHQQSSTDGNSVEHPKTVANRRALVPA